MKQEKEEEEMIAMVRKKNERTIKLSINHLSRRIRRKI